MCRWALVAKRTLSSLFRASTEIIRARLSGFFGALKRAVSLSTAYSRCPPISVMQRAAPHWAASAGGNGHPSAQLGLTNIAD